MLQYAEYTAKGKCCSVSFRYKVLFVKKLTLLQSHFFVSTASSSQKKEKQC